MNKIFEKSSFIKIVSAFVALLLLEPSISFAVESPAKTVTLEDLGICESKARQVFGMFTPICRLLISSPGFRSVCASVPQEDRIRCDGTEPTTMAFSMEARTECAKKFAAGFAENLQQSYELLTDFVHLAGILIGVASDWAFPSAEASEVPLTDDIAPYTEATVADPSENIDWGALLANPEFWEIFRQEARIALEETGEEYMSEAVRYLCYNPLKRHQVTCEIAGNIIGFGMVLKVLRLFKSAKLLPKDKIREELRKIFAERKLK